MKKSLLFIILLIHLCSSCVIRKYYNIYYQTGLPLREEYEYIVAREYEEYFIQDIYFSCNAFPLSRNYYDKIMHGPPYRIFLGCATHNDSYDKIVIENIHVASESEEYIQSSKVNLYLQIDYINPKNNIQYISSESFKDDSGNTLFDFDYKNGEKIRVEVTVAVYDKEKKVHRKNLSYELKPKIDICYLRLITDLL